MDNITQELLELAKEYLTRQEVLDSYKKIISQILKVEVSLINRIDKTTVELKNLHSNLKGETNNDLNKLENKLNEYKQILDKFKSDFRLLRDGTDGYTPVKGKDYFDGLPGKDADEGKIVGEVLSKIKLPELEIDSIKGLREALEELKVKTGGRTFGGGGGFSYIAMQQHIIDDETPSGTINGVNTNFTLLSAPNPTNSLKVFRGGARQRVTEDYTLSGRTITFITPPVVGEVILCDYLK